MKTINPYNFSEILNGIRNGKVSKLYIISSQTFSDDINCETEFKWDNEPYFAGSTVEEATEALEDVTAITSADEFEYIELSVRTILVNADTFADVYDDDNAEDIILGFAGENASNAEWEDYDLMRSVWFEYENIDGAILVYWSWNTYIGYSRKFIRFELCNNPYVTTLYCKPSKRVFQENCDVLVNPSDVKACKNASELLNLMNEKIAAMKLWRNDYNASDFLQYAYKNSERYGYELPENDLYNEEDD